MPRALTPAVLEMCEPPPPPRRWGWMVPTSVLALARGGALGDAGRPSAREGPELQRRAEAAFRADRFADAAEYARHAVRRFAADDPRSASLLRLRRESLARIGGIDQALTTREAAEPAVP